MKKLKKFVLNDARLLSRDEMATIEGSLDLHLEDHCRNAVQGAPCVYTISYDASGRQTVVIGECYITYVQSGSNIVKYGYCI